MPRSVTQKIEYLGVQDLYAQNCKTLMKKSKDLDKQNLFLQETQQMSVRFKSVCKFNKIAKQNYSKIYMERQRN